jgi:hypothetical protein
MKQQKHLAPLKRRIPKVSHLVVISSDIKKMSVNVWNAAQGDQVRGSLVVALQVALKAGRTARTVSLRGGATLPGMTKDAYVRAQLTPRQRQSIPPTDDSVQSSAIAPS